MPATVHDARSLLRRLPSDWTVNRYCHHHGRVCVEFGGANHFYSGIFSRRLQNSTFPPLGITHAAERPPFNAARHRPRTPGYLFFSHTYIRGQQEEISFPKPISNPTLRIHTSITHNPPQSPTLAYSRSLHRIHITAGRHAPHFQLRSPIQAPNPTFRPRPQPYIQN